MGLFTTPNGLCVFMGFLPCACRRETYTIWFSVQLKSDHVFEVEVSNTILEEGAQNL